MRDVFATTLLAALLAAAPAAAAPVLIGPAALTPFATEGFDGIEATDPGVTLLELPGFAVTSLGGVGVGAVPEFCGGSPGNCLFSLASGAGLGLDGFGGDVTAVAFDLTAGASGSIVRLIASRGSGEAVFFLDARGRFAVSDSLGLQSLAFLGESVDSGEAAFGIDRVTTGRTVATAPLPPTVAAMLSVLAIFASHSSWRRR